ncbi:ankyrin repeat domain-containing protein 50-like [Haliotis rubra]|uniref:ankyrin repeat domain-containing protein 50-like n=1 Tax=Haliotis rubra TaxID=36100 RepID=UPI001EE4ECBB|nr:ankyrin repeat domain-containing protein 50-like [Haliotis rubra]
METQEDSPLHDACRNGYLGRVKRILSQGLVDVNSRGEKHRKTPLMLAAQEGHRQVFVFLVKKGANVSHIDQYGDNVLHLACRGGHISIVKDLVRHHMIDINSKGMYGSTPLLQTVYCGQIDVFHILVFCGANLSDMDDVGENILHVACRGGHFGMVKNVLKYYSDYINSRDNHGETPLMKAVSEGHIYVFDFLVSLGANVSHAADNGDNILHLASTGGHTKMVQYILSQDLVNINSRGKYGATPLMKAAHKGHMEIFKYLVGMKADVSQVDDDGDNILHYASIGEHTKIVQYILSLDLVDINSRGKYGRTALTRAVYYGQRKVLDLLASKGGLTNLVDAEGQSILHLASLGGRVEMVKYILSQNLADINARDNDGDTAAMIAKRNGKLDVYNFLVSQVVQ